MRALIRLFFLTGLLPLAAMAQEDPAAQIAQAKANEQRLRDTLRTTTQQLRTAETEKATLLAGQTERDQKIAELEARVKAITQQANDDKTKADKSIAEFKATENKAGLEIARLTTALEKWKAAYNQAAGVVRKTETVRAQLDSANVVLERKVADRERQNLELYKTASEILQRYRDFGLGRAIAAREPFTGVAKAKIEEQVQDYSDKLEDNKLKPEPSDGKPSTQPASAGKPVPDSPKSSPKTK